MLELPTRYNMDDVGDQITRDNGFDQRALSLNIQQRMQDMEQHISMLINQQSQLQTNNLALHCEIARLNDEIAALRVPAEHDPRSVCSTWMYQGGLPEIESSRETESRLASSITGAQSPSRELRSSQPNVTFARPKPIPRRAHKKSKTGCHSCKARKVKVRTPRYGGEHVAHYPDGSPV